MFAFPIDSNGIRLFEGVNEVKSVGARVMFDAEVVNA